MRVLVSLTMALAIIALALAASGQEPSGSGYFDLDLEELVKIDVRLVSRTPESQFEAPSAVYVLTSDDIRRSGIVRLPELLRLVPGVNVRQVDANSWAISTRHLASRFSSLMLVQMDGRTIYTPLFAGVHWEMHDYPVEDIERIEVIRGPGAALWGANAVTGIINIVTKHSAATQGTRVAASGGYGSTTGDAYMRHGGSFGERGSWRAYLMGRRTAQGEWVDDEDIVGIAGTDPGEDADDDGEAFQAGFRLDSALGGGEFTAIGHVNDSRFSAYRNPNGDAVINHDVDTAGRSLLGRYRSSGVDPWQFQLYHDWTERHDMAFEETRHITDVDAQKSFAFERNLLLFGAGFRYISDETSKTESGVFALQPADAIQRVYSAFVQDRLHIVPERLDLIAGVKFEHNIYTQEEWQPSVRLLARPDESSTLWAAWTRALHTPSRTGVDGILDFSPGPIVPIGVEDAESLVSRSYEIGARRELSEQWMADLALHYDNFQEGVNSSEGSSFSETLGGEIVLRGQLREDVRLELWSAYSEVGQIRGDGTPKLNSTVPRFTTRLRLQWNLDSRSRVDFMFYRREPIHRSDTEFELDPLNRVDLRFAYDVRPGVELSVAGSNLLDDVHAESFQNGTRAVTGVKRGVVFRIVTDF